MLDNPWQFTAHDGTVTYWMTESNARRLARDGFGIAEPMASYNE